MITDQCPEQGPPAVKPAVVKKQDAFKDLEKSFIGSINSVEKSLKSKAI